MFSSLRRRSLLFPLVHLVRFRSVDYSCLGRTPAGSPLCDRLSCRQLAPASFGFTGCCMAFCSGSACTPRLYATRVSAAHALLCSFSAAVPFYHRPTKLTPHLWPSACRFAASVPLLFSPMKLVRFRCILKMVSQTLSMSFVRTYYIFFPTSMTSSSSVIC